jgi:hypothetical protein
VRRYSSEVQVARPPDVVYPWIVDLDKQAQWSDVQMQLLSPAPLRAGSRMQLTFGKPPMRATLVLEITARDEGRRFAWTTVGKGPISWDGEYRLEPAGASGTRLSQAGTLRFHGLWRLLEPIVGAEIRANEVKELEKLKGLVEAAG